MIRKIVFILLLHFVAISAAVCQPEVLNQLAPLKGTWKADIKGKIIYETWRTGVGDELSGMSYKLNGKDTIVFEQTRIVNQNRKLSYIAKVTNQNEGKEVAFKLVSSSNNTFVFENPEHDFPQRVAYQFVSADSLHAWIDGKYKGKMAREDYYYQRLK